MNAGQPAVRGGGHHVRLDVAGLRADVRSPDEAVAAELAATWSRCLSTGTGDAELDLSLEELDSSTIVDTLTTLAAERVKLESVVLRACGLSTSDGRVVALLAGRGGGKTTAASRLGRRFGYVSDERVLVDATGAVTPLPRPLLLREASDRDVRVAGPDELGLMTCVTSLRLSRLVVLDRREDAVPRIEVYEPAEALIELWQHAPDVGELRRPLRRLHELIRASGGLLRLVYSEIEHAGDLLEELFDGPIQRLPRFTPLDDVVADAELAHWALRDARVRRVPPYDSIAIGDDVVLFLGETAVLVSGIGLTIWDAAIDAPTFGETLHRVIERHGDHPDAERLVRAAMDDLCEAHVLGFARPVPLQSFMGPTGPGA